MSRGRGEAPGHGPDGRTPGRRPSCRVGADVGGTFTDVVAFDPETRTLGLGKTLSTPARLADGIAAAVGRAGVRLAEAGLFLHGSTIAINTMLERTGARAALLITEGFRDVYEIGRVNRPDSYNLFFRKHVPLIERAMCFEVRERMLAEGTALTPLDEDGVRALADRLAALDVESVAILLLHSYRNPDHERRVKAILQERLPQAFVTASCDLCQEYREFERCSTVAANAYIGPRVRSYLGEIEARLEAERFPGAFLVVQSTGGLYDARQAREDCVHMLESGPAAGVIAGRTLARGIGVANAVTFDMGGTTAKSGVIHGGEALTTGSAMIGGYEQGLPVQIAMMDICEVGTGGGSIARVDPQGALRVGPESAGARPGPACYGTGGRAPTVTDANLILGRIAPERFLGGEMRLDAAAAHRAMQEAVAGPLGMDAVAAAAGVLRIAATAMSFAVKGVSTERGLDAGDFVLIAFGGAGPLHASAVARELGMREIVVPAAPGHFSALGMLHADLRYDHVRTWFARLADAPFAEIERLYGEMERRGRDSVAAAGAAVEEILVGRAADMRYVGQEHAVTVDLPAAVFAAEDRTAIKTHFDSVHALRYGTSAPEEAAELVSLRSTVIGVLSKPPLVAAGGTGAATAETRRVYFSEAGGFVETPVHARAALAPGAEIAGPAVVEEAASTTLLLPGDRMTVCEMGNLRISVGRPGA